MPTVAVPPVNLRDHLGRHLDRPLRVAVVGAGARGAAYARHLADCGAHVTAVAEPRDEARYALAQAYGIPHAARFTTWVDLVAAPRTADAVLITVQDREHASAATEFARAGYDILLEKPIAPTEEECLQVLRACEGAGVWLGVCHVLLYAPYTRLVRRLLDHGVIGDVVSVEHLEPVGYWHFAHSYVRGSWRKEATAGPVLLTKSSHDLDWLSHVVGRPVARVSSFGALTHFQPEAAPEGAGERCLDCTVEPTCPWSAARIYRRGLDPRAREAYFTRVMAPAGTPEAVEEALRTGPYGRCVYRCDNDVLDHQVVTLEYDGGVTATFTLSAFTPMEHRRTRIFGTRGQLTTDGTRKTAASAQTLTALADGLKNSVSGFKLA